MELFSIQSFQLTLNAQMVTTVITPYTYLVDVEKTTEESIVFLSQIVIILAPALAETFIERMSILVVGLTHASIDHVPHLLQILL